MTFFLALGPTLGSRQGSGLKAMKFGAQDFRVYSGAVKDLKPKPYTSLGHSDATLQQPSSCLGFSSDAEGTRFVVQGLAVAWRVWRKFVHHCRNSVSSRHRRWGKISAIH